MAKAYLVDVNVLIARLIDTHEHHCIVSEWFATPELSWVLCPWAEAGFLRFATRPDRLTMSEASGLIEALAEDTGCQYRASSSRWSTLTGPFSRRLHGHKQVTDAYLLGQAIEEDLILTTLDKRILHLAGEYSQHVFVIA